MPGFDDFADDSVALFLVAQAEEAFILCLLEWKLQMHGSLLTHEVHTDPRFCRFLQTEGLVIGLSYPQKLRAVGTSWPVVKSFPLNVCEQSMSEVKYPTRSPIDEA